MGVYDQIIKNLGSRTDLTETQQKTLDSARSKVGETQAPINTNPVQTTVATSATPTKVTGDITTQTLQQPIDNAKPTTNIAQQPIGVNPVPTPTPSQIETTPSPTTVTTAPNVELRGSLEAQGVNVYWNPENGTVTANGVPVDTSRMQLVDGRYQASQEDIDNILAQVNQNQVQPQGQSEGQNINDIEQQYMQDRDTVRSQYADTIKGFEEGLGSYKPLYAEDITNALREAFGNPFEYNPDADRGLQDAMKYAEREIVNSMNARGILNSSITRDQMGEMISSMIPQYEQIAFERYQQNINNQLKRVDVLQNLSEQDYTRYTDYIDMAMGNAESLTTMALDTMEDNYNIMYEQTVSRPLQERKDALDETDKLINMAYDKLKTQGYVDNEIAKITGLRPGALSMEVQEQLNGYRLSSEEQQALINNEITIADIQHRAKLQQIEEQKIETQNMEDAKIAIGQLESYLNTLSADEAQRFWNSNYSDIINGLGDGYSYVSEDMQRINEALSKRSLDERKQSLQEKELGLDVQKENRLSSTSTDAVNDEQKDLSLITEIATYESYPVKDAIKFLREDKEILQETYGVDGYKKIWDNALANAIRMGQAEPYGYNAPIPKD